LDALAGLRHLHNVVLVPQVVLGLSIEFEHAVAEQALDDLPTAIVFHQTS
jgi:hypothetical protein